MNDDYNNEFYEVVYDAEGNSRTILRQQISKKSQTSSGFTTYDDSHGHCALCGSLACHGRCFK